VARSKQPSATIKASATKKVIATTKLRLVEKIDTCADNDSILETFGLKAETHVRKKRREDREQRALEERWEMDNLVQNIFQESPENRFGYFLLSLQYFGARGALPIWMSDQLGQYIQAARNLESKQNWATVFGKMNEDDCSDSIEERAKRYRERVIHYCNELVKQGFADDTSLRDEVAIKIGIGSPLVETYWQSHKKTKEWIKPKRPKFPRVKVPKDETAEQAKIRKKDAKQARRRKLKTALREIQIALSENLKEQKPPSN
jgi:hypothetical protein